MKNLKYLLLGVFLFCSFGTFNVLAAESADNGKMYWSTSLSDAAYNINGYVGSKLYGTTYSNSGYRIVLKVEEKLLTVKNLQNGVEKLLKMSKLDDATITSTVGLTITPTFVNDGNYVKVTYTVRNLLNEEQIISIGTWADSQIGSNDSALLSIIDDSVIEMSDGQSAQFNLVTSNAYGVTDTTTKWIGYYGDAGNNAFTNTSAIAVTGIDSGLSFSWKDVSFSANETKDFSVLYGVGTINKAPTITINEVIKTGERTLKIKGNVSDEDSINNTKIYYSVDNAEPVLMYTFPNQPGNFEANITLTEAQIQDENEILFYAQDENGAISNSEKKIVSNPTFMITTGSEKNGTFTIDKNSAREGAVVTVIAKPNKGYIIKSIMANNNKVTNSTFNMPNQNVIVTVQFEKLPENPQTEDGIMNSIVLGSISLIGSFGTILYTKKKELN